MSGLLDYSQTSENEWDSAPIGMIYHPFQQSMERPAQSRQLADFLSLEEQMTRFEAEHRALVEEVRKFYVTPTDLPIEEFFRRYRTLPQVLIEAIPFLRRFLGETVFALRPTSDEYGWQRLFVDALWPGEAHDAIAGIDAFEDEWWIANSNAASGSLTFTYRLV